MYAIPLLWIMLLIVCCGNDGSALTSFHGETAWEVIATST